jgi:tetratricopeptide (TPR) repeat protein
MEALFDRLQKRLRCGDVKSALLEIEALERTANLTPRLLVLKAMCLQLSEEDGPLEEVEIALRAALSMDDEYIDAHLELGWFLYAVQDQTSEGKKHFDEALHLLRKLNSEAIRGLLACAEELTPEESQVELRAKLGNLLLTEIQDKKAEDPA